MVANPALPRKMRFGISEGMVMAAGPGGKDIFLLSPDAGAKTGSSGEIIPSRRCIDSLSL